MLNLGLVFYQRNLDFGLMLTLEDLIVGQIHWNEDEKYKCSCFYNIDDVPSQGSPVMRNDTAMMYYLSHLNVICTYHNLFYAKILHNSKWEGDIVLFPLTFHACQVYHHMERIYFHWKVWKVWLFNAGKLFLKILTSVWDLRHCWQDWQSWRTKSWKLDGRIFKEWKSVKKPFKMKILLLFWAWQEHD